MTIEAQKVSESEVPCFCPECRAVIKRCFACSVKRFGEQVIKDHGPFIGGMVMKKIEEFLTKNKD